MGGIVLLAAIAGGLAFAVLVGLALCVMRKQGLLYCCGGSEPFSAAHRELGGVSGAAGDDGDSGGGGKDRHNDTYTQLEVLAAARPAAAPLASPPPLLAPYGAGKTNGVRGAGEERKTKEARYAVGSVLHRNMQDPAVAFKFGSEVGTLEGPQSVGKTIVVDAVYTDERYVRPKSKTSTFFSLPLVFFSRCRGDMKYRVRDAKASCKVTVLEKHFDQRCEHPTPFVVGDTVVRNNVDRKVCTDDVFVFVETLLFDLNFHDLRVADGVQHEGQPGDRAAWYRSGSCSCMSPILPSSNPLLQRLQSPPRIFTSCGTVAA